MLPDFNTVSGADVPSSTSVQPLGYAPRGRFRRRTYLKWATAVLVIAGLTLAAWQWGPGVWRHAELLYWQRQCMNYAAPADQVVYEEDPDAARAMLSLDGYFRGSRGASAYRPRCLRELMRCEYERWDPAWATHAPDCAVIFVHRLTAKHGATRLVTVVTDSRWPPPNSWPSGLDASIETPTPWFRDLSSRETLDDIDFSTSDFRMRVEQRPDNLGIRFYAGQPDPSDLSHFTIRYQRHGQAGIIDGWLLDDKSSPSLRLATRKESEKPVISFGPLGPAVAGRSR